ncbi:Sigma-70, region 4 [Pseudobutyrivibrio sp. UC1225]|uniref:RNA polymerase sigma factor n=1 Tax=Pseudobutyrivibrio sp. UC1225 TaxID=1798185 RepID=UPI0008E43C82|nr:sigma-70 family RNA polymerase sigma factor [Pseudobutyrivibrio sp. UC1225]SFO03677.1 Sigma-70, region 4 [Pseudobutyrivibrio sp. UC1225]
MNTKNENKEYELINLEIEYPGIQGGVKWAVISDLSEEVIKERFEEELKKYWPYIVLPVEQGNVIKEFHRNEHKHDMREKRNTIPSSYEEGVSESLFSFFSCLMTEEEAIYSEEIGRMIEKLDSLTAVQRRRIRLYFFEGLTFREIAEIEGVSQKNVFKSVKAALEKIKNFSHEG